MWGGVPPDVMVSRRSGVIKTAPARRESAGVGTGKISTPGPRLLLLSKGANATCRVVMSNRGFPRALLSIKFETHEIVSGKHLG